MSVLALGLSHATAPQDLRARFAVPAERLAPSVAALRSELGTRAAEAALLSTCNRTELYVATDDAERTVPAAFDWLAAHAGVEHRHLKPHVYARAGDDAARHAFRVASGLDSMVLGEPQILGQLKQAVRAATAAGTLGQTLHQLFQRSFSVAKAVRSSTEIGHCAVSYGAAAVQLAQELFGELPRLSVLCVGAGEMVASVAAHFHGKGAGTLVVANRDAARGTALAERVGGSFMPLSALPARLAGFDVVVSCTASPLPLIGLGAVESALKARRRRPMLLVDLALPRDIEPEVARLSDAYLYTLDDLAQRVQRGGERRRQAVHSAEQLVEAGVRDFGRWLEQRPNVPLIRALQQRAEDWQATELARAHRRLARGDSADEVLRALAHGLGAKLLHGSLRELRRGDAGMRAAVERLFLQR